MSEAPPRIAPDAGWLAEPAFKALLAVLSAGGEEARIAGGAVRDALLGEPVSDVDVATTMHPEAVIRAAEAAGFRAVPTGIEHGTVTVIAQGRVCEVTTLREDIETDGRHAKVVFGRDWKRDAERRDFTINGLYAEADGTVVDLVGGVADLRSGTLRFIGDPEARIREDFLRILRFFRFFARYGSGRPDAAGLKACARLKDGLARLSAERVWSELKKLLAAPEPARALLWMRQASVLTAVLPESEKWGIDAVHGLVGAERDLGWAPDAMLRLAAIVPPDPGRIASLSERLKLSNADKARLDAWAEAPVPDPDLSEDEFARYLYRHGTEGIADRLRLALAHARQREAQSEAAGHARLLDFLGTWQRPALPIGGDDLKPLGIAAGPAMGALLRELEDAWIASDFKLTRGALLERAAERA